MGPVAAAFREPRAYPIIEREVGRSRIDQGIVARNRGVSDIGGASAGFAIGSSERLQMLVWSTSFPLFGLHVSAIVVQPALKSLITWFSALKCVTESTLLRKERDRGWNRG